MARLERIAQAMRQHPELADISHHAVARIALITPGGLDALEEKYLKSEQS